MHLETLLCSVWMLRVGWNLICNRGGLLLQFHDQAVMYVQRTFVPSLAEDYAKWATSETYRQQRVQHAIDSDAALHK